ncbi:MAG TPA: SHOCT domain-containing protein [Euryarchaeota archaeon]|nr:MAG: hypothetical protein DRN45_05635 [Thermococci archaeon]HEC96013.1 SHOCT domain-containing protein [Euryarchaeota archaeon]
MRFLSETCYLRGIPNKSAARIFRTIQERIANVRSILSSPQPISEDPLKILKIRYAKGEITREEYLLMKRELER